jgi:TetR/AcrR family transcriptional regulator
MGDKDRKDQILKVAEELFAQNGYSKTTMREIAERLEIKKPSLYHHFRSKEEIYSKIIIDIYRQVLDEVISLLDRCETVQEMVELSLESMIDLWAKHPNYLKLLAYEMVENTQLFSSEAIPKIGQPRFNKAVEKLQQAAGTETRYREADIPMLVLVAFNAPFAYFFSSQILSTFLGRDCLAPEMIEKFKREITNLFLYGLQEIDK